MNKEIEINGNSYLGTVATEKFVKEKTGATISVGQISRVAQMVPHVYLNGEIHFRREDLEEAIQKGHIQPSKTNPNRIRLRRVGGRFIAKPTP